MEKTSHLEAALPITICKINGQVWYKMQASSLDQVMNNCHVSKGWFSNEFYKTIIVREKLLSLYFLGVNIKYFVISILIIWLKSAYYLNYFGGLSLSIKISILSDNPNIN